MRVILKRPSAALNFPKFLAVFLLAALVPLTACSSTPVPEVANAAIPKSETTPTAPAPRPDDAYIASGPIVVENQVDVLALRTGVIAQISVDVGTPVHKGDVLALMDDREAVAQRDAAQDKLKSCEADLKDWEAETKLAQTDYERAQRMRESGINTQEGLDHARYKFEGSKFEIEKATRELDSARDNLRFYELELQKTRVEAPFDGVVARRYVRAGQTAAQGDRLFWVSAVAPLLVKFTLPERFLTQVKTGKIVYVSSISMPEQTYPAKVVQMSPLVDPASDSIDVLAKLEGKPAGLRAGMTANIRLSPPGSSSR